MPTGYYIRTPEHREKIKQGALMAGIGLANIYGVSRNTIYKILEVI